MWRMGRRKVINNLWMKSNKRLGEGPVCWTSRQRDSTVADKGKRAAKRCRNYAKKPEIKQMGAHTNMESKGKMLRQKNT